MSSNDWAEQARAINSAFAAQEAALIAELQIAKNLTRQAEQDLVDRVAQWELESERRQAHDEIVKVERGLLLTEMDAVKQEASHLVVRLAECERRQSDLIRVHRERLLSLSESAAASKAEKDRLLVELDWFRGEASQRESRVLESAETLVKGLAFEQRQTIEFIRKSEFERERSREDSERTIKAELQRQLDFLHQGQSELTSVVAQLQFELKAARGSWFAKYFRGPRITETNERLWSADNIKVNHVGTSASTKRGAGSATQAAECPSTQVMERGSTEDTESASEEVASAAMAELAAVPREQIFSLPLHQLSSGAMSNGAEHAMTRNQQATENIRQTLISILRREPKEFLDHSYQLLLGRACDVTGKAHFLEEMYRGTSKLQIMNDIAHSAEGGGRSVYSGEIAKFNKLERLKKSSLLGFVVKLFIRRRSLNYPSVAEVVLDLHGREFVEQAYAQILRRDPDRDGLTNALVGLYDGIPKLDIIGGMLQSHEYKTRKLENREFRRLVRRQRTSRIPLIGSTVAGLLGLESRTRQGINIRAIREIQHLLIDKFNQQDERLKTVQRQLAVTASRAIAAGRETDEEFKSTTLDKNYRREQDYRHVLKMKQALTAR